MAIFDFERLGARTNPDAQWRQRTTEMCLFKAWELQRDVCLVGQTVLREILSCPSMGNFERLWIGPLDVSDQARIVRMKDQGPESACNQNTLNWSLWLRVHFDHSAGSSMLLQRKPGKEWI